MIQNALIRKQHLLLPAPFWLELTYFGAGGGTHTLFYQ